MKNEYVKLKEYMEQSGKTVAVTGAGISYLYGMRRLKKRVGVRSSRQVFSASYVRQYPDKFYTLMRDTFLDATFVKGPSAVHKQLAKLEQSGQIFGIVTQNMDCLHTVAGSKNVAEFQGSFADNICIDCQSRGYDYNVWNQGHMPRCEKCGAPIMPTSFYTESDVRNLALQKAMQKAINMIAEADLVIIIGTTGFRSEEYMSRIRPSARIVQINPSETKFDAAADLNIRADAAEALDAVINQSETG
ncbi:MAG: NAD-dependent protein deacetylase [Firmicutes bacterium]|nr:NAD-dependent protein deacetylase [Bacillota bacterium]